MITRQFPEKCRSCTMKYLKLWCNRIFTFQNVYHAVPSWRALLVVSLRSFQWITYTMLSHPGKPFWWLPLKLSIEVKQTPGNASPASDCGHLPGTRSWPVCHTMSLYSCLHGVADFFKDHNKPDLKGRFPSTTAFPTGVVLCSFAANLLTPHDDGLATQ